MKMRKFLKRHLQSVEEYILRKKMRYLLDTNIVIAYLNNESFIVDKFFYLGNIDH